MIVRRLLICGIYILGSCVQQLSASGAASPLQNYRQLIADSDVIATLRNKFVFSSPLEVSQLHPSVLTQLGDWTACVRVSFSGFKSPPSPTAQNAKPAQRQPLLPPLSYYVFFFAGGAIVDSRPAVIIDRCADVTYSPLPSPGKKKKPD
jgi:hypothetical protein